MMNPTNPSRTNNPSTTNNLRWLNVVLGAWLFISAFAWPHSSEQMTNTWVVGALTVGAALAAMRYPQARFANTLLAIWLFISAFALPRVSEATPWNNAIVAIAMFVVSLAPGAAVPPRERLTSVR